MTDGSVFCGLQKAYRFIINDYGGSDYSEPIIFIANNPDRAIYVRKQLQEQMGNNASIFGNHHVYIVGAEWLSDKSIKIKIYGYGDVDPNGFTLWYEYILGDGFKFIKRDRWKKIKRAHS